MSTYRPTIYADERNGGPIINCVAASGVNLARAATNGAISPADGEVVALRKATGDVVGGQTLRQLQTGLKNRYGFGGYLASVWSAFRFEGPEWYAALGYLHSLPKRCWSQPSDVFHCIAVTGDIAGHVIIIDPLQKPKPVPQRLTVEEFRTFAGSGGYSSLRVDEFSEIPHVAVDCMPLGRTFLYARSGDNWKRRTVWRVQFSGTCTKAMPFTVLGKTRKMVRMTSGVHSPHTWLDINAAHIVYRQ